WIRALADALLVGDRGKLIRGRQRHLDVAGRVAFEEIDFVLRETPGLPDLRDHGAAGRADAAGGGDTGRGPLPHPIELVFGTEPFDRFVEVAHESGAAQLAVGEDLEAGILLALQDVENVPIFNRGELVAGDARIAASRQQLLRPQQAADVVRTV